MAQKFLAFFDDCFTGLAQLVGLLTEVVEGLRAALTKRFPGLLTRQQRGYQRTDGP